MIKCNIPVRLLFVLLFWQAFMVYGQNGIIPQKPAVSEWTDSSRVDQEVSVIPDAVRKKNRKGAFAQRAASANSLYANNQFLNRLPQAVNKKYRERHALRYDALFYLLLALALMLGILRTAFPRYFSNLFRVFFNTSLRQSQLTDQLLQTPLPSFLFNIFFILSVSVFIFLYLGHSGKHALAIGFEFLPYCLLLLSGVYLLKFCFVKFVGWVSGMQREASRYIFIVFLVNKIIGICLFPVLPVLAFSGADLAGVAAMLASVVLVLLMAIRVLRTYGLASAALRMDRFHFLLYIMALEVIPLLVLFRGAVILLDKKV